MVKINSTKKIKGKSGARSLTLAYSAAFSLAMTALVLTGNSHAASKSKAKVDKIKTFKYRKAPLSRAIEGQYIVVLKPDIVQKRMQSLANGDSFSTLSLSAKMHYRSQAIEKLSATVAGEYSVTVDKSYAVALAGFTANMESWEMEKLILDDRVDYIEEDMLVYASEIQNNATFGLDRIDQPDLPLNGQYEFNLDGSGVDAYILDTGILASHPDFNGRVDTNRGFSAVNDGRGTDDCDGHGTHVAGTVGSETFGVAKDVTLLPVRVLGCGGSGSISGVIAGVDFVTRSAIDSGRPSVANMSLGGGNSGALDSAVQRGIDAGVTFVVAAGNSNVDACNGSPNRVADAITVASSTSTDARSGFSNFGACVDIFAPGSGITSTFNDGGFAQLSGTSMASPHVAGVVALALEADPTASPAEIENILESAAARNKIRNVSGSPNLLVQTDFGDVAPPPPQEPPPAPPGDCFYQATFEAGADGWTNNNTCSTGAFDRGTPNQTQDGGIILQVEGAAVGTGAWFTAPNASVGVNDVDDGTCETRSPTIDVSSVQNVDISLNYFHGQRDAGDDSTDGFIIDVLDRNGAVVETLERHGDVTHVAEWTNIRTTIASPGDIQLRVRATDGANGGDIVEGGIDQVLVCPSAATPPPPPEENPGSDECDVEESFEAGAGGWFQSVASTCTTGDYVLGAPVTQSDGGVLTQPSGANSGSAAVFTAVNSSVGLDDVDGGNCIAQSPVYGVTSNSTLSVAFFHGQRDSADGQGEDFFRLEFSRDGGNSFETLAANDDVRSNADWTSASAQVSAGDDVVVRVQCSDGASAGDIIECGVDDVTICPN